MRATKDWKLQNCQKENGKQSTLQTISKLFIKWEGIVEMKQGKYEKLHECNQ